MKLKATKAEFAGTVYNNFYIDNNEAATYVANHLLKSDVKTLGLDLETAKHRKYVDYKPPTNRAPAPGLNPYLSEIRLMQLYDGKNVFVMDLWKVDINIFRKVLYAKQFIAHNALFEINHLSKAGFPDLVILCSMIMARLVDTAERSPFDADEEIPDDDIEEYVAVTGARYRNRYGLNEVAKRLFGISISKQLQTSDWNAVQLSKDQIAYAGLDALLTLQIGTKLFARLKELGMLKVAKLYTDILHPVSSMELNGFSLDKKEHDILIKSWVSKSEALSKELKSKWFGDMNLNSSKQLNAWAYEYFKDRPEVLDKWAKTDRGSLTFNKDKVVLTVNDEAVLKLLEYKKLQKLITSYGQNLQSLIHPITKKLHCSFRVGEVRTGRLSSSSPNLQNLSRDTNVRNLFTASKGNVLVVYDFSQIETRVAGEISKDPVILKAYRDNLDLYKLTGSLILKKPMEEITKEDRQIAKACFSGDTEVLTRKGWVALKDYTEGEVMQYSLPAGVEYNKSYRSTSSRFSMGIQNVEFKGLGGELSYAMPTGSVVYKDRKLTQYKDRRNSIKVTNDHDIIYVDSNSNVYKKPLQDIRFSSVRSFINAGWLQRTQTIGSKYVRFIACLMADGSFVSSNVYRFGFTKRRKYRRLVEVILRDLVGDATYIQKKNAQGVTTITVTVSDGLRDIINKYSNKYKTLSWETLTDFCPLTYLEEAQYWDSHYSKENKIITFSTINKQTIDVMQAMAHTTGILFNYRIVPGKGNRVTHYVGIYSMNYQPLSRPNFKDKIESVEDVYCLEVPSGALLIRHEGKISIQGNCVLGLLFGMGAKSFKSYAKSTFHLDVEEDQAKIFYRQFHNTYKVYSKWCDQQRHMCERTGIAKSMMGKIRKLADNEIYTKSVNTPIQGTAAEIMMLALIKIYKRLKDTNAKLVNVVHDEVIVDCPEADVEKVKVLIEESMRDAMLYIFPKASVSKLVEGGIAKKYGEAK